MELQDEDCCLAFVDSCGGEERYSLAQAVGLAREVARRLRPRLTQPSSAVAVDLPNRPLFVWALLACALLGRPFVALNHRLSPDEKRLRLGQLEGRLEIGATIDEGWMLAAAGKDSGEPVTALDADAGPDDILRAADPDAVAVVMFTSGTTGTPKAAALTWRNLLASAEASNESLQCGAKSLWQGVLPLYHIGGLQVALRSLVAGCPLRLYARFDADRVLEDARRCGATHISVVDKVLRDLVEADRRLGGHVLPGYRCLLLGGAALNEATVAAARDAGARVYASYGMTETASQVANRLVDGSFDGGLRLLPGVEARILDPDADGAGELALRGPSVIGGYLNAPARRDSDGFFLTNDRASMRGGLLYVCERIDDLFISGGENVYPAEIESCLNQVEGVSASCVLGVPDETWGRRPAALIESSLDPRVAEKRAREHAQRCLSALSRPDVVIAVREMPRQGIGKPDRAAVRALLEERLKHCRE